MEDERVKKEMKSVQNEINKFRITILDGVLEFTRSCKGETKFSSMISGILAVMCSQLSNVMKALGTSTNMSEEKFEEFVNMVTDKIKLECPATFKIKKMKSGLSGESELDALVKKMKERQ